MGKEQEGFRIQAIIWDFDGTIVDTETPQYEAWDTLFRGFGVHLLPTVWGQMVGTVTDLDLFDVLEDLTGNPVDRFALHRQVQDLITERMRTAPLRAGVRDLMEAAGTAGRHQAIASSSPGWWIREFVERHHLGGFLRVIASSDDVLRVKPDPSVYRHALTTLGLSPDLGVAIEDSPHGSVAALAAGLACLVVPNPSTASLLFPPGVVRVETLEGLSLDALERMLA